MVNVLAPAGEHATQQYLRPEKSYPTVANRTPLGRAPAAASDRQDVPPLWIGGIASAGSRFPTRARFPGPRRARSLGGDGSITTGSVHTRDPSYTTMAIFQSMSGPAMHVAWNRSAARRMACSVCAILMSMSASRCTGNPGTMLVALRCSMGNNCTCGAWPPIHRMSARIGSRAMTAWNMKLVKNQHSKRTPMTPTVLPTMQLSRTGDTGASNCLP